MGSENRILRVNQPIVGVVTYGARPQSNRANNNCINCDYYCQIRTRNFFDLNPFIFVSKTSGEWKAVIMVTLEQIRAVLLKTSTATVGDVLRGMGNSVIVCDPAIKSAKPGWKFCGQAYTLQYLPYRKGDTSSKDGPEERKTIEMPKTYGVVVIATCPALRNGQYWGENKTAQAKASGAIARVVDGLSRDTREHIELDFPLFLRGSTSGAVLGSPDFAPKTISTQANVPVVFGGVRCEPGDIVMGDDDGIIIIPRVEAEKALPHILWMIDYEERLGKASKDADFEARAKLKAEHDEQFKKLKNL